MNLSSFLKQYRRNNCLSQGDIARITGLDRTTIFYQKIYYLKKLQTIVVLKVYIRQSMV